MIKILHLYYDLLNLNGEQGNVLYLKYVLEQSNIKYKIDYLSIGDKIDFSNYDYIYMGKGSEESLLRALKDLLQYKKDVKKYIDESKYFIATGNSHELFGKYIVIDNKKHEALNIFDYYIEELESKIIGDVFARYNDLDIIIGFINTKREIVNNQYPLFELESNNFNLEREGVKYNNFYGTYLLGPILVRNPHFLDSILLDNQNIKYKINKDKIQYKAYNEYINNFYKKGEEDEKIS